MRGLVAGLILALGSPVLAQEGLLAPCDPACRAARAVAEAMALQLCKNDACGLATDLGPAWQSGRMDGAHPGGFASGASDSGAEQIILTCESRGPMSVILRSGRTDRGEVQFRVDGAGVEWLVLEQRGGVLVAELPRATRLVHALQDGNVVEVVGADGSVTARFALRGSDRAITAAMDHCAER